MLTLYCDPGQKNNNINQVSSQQGHWALILAWTIPKVIFINFIAQGQLPDSPKWFAIKPGNLQINALPTHEDNGSGLRAYID